MAYVSPAASIACGPQTSPVTLPGFSALRRMVALAHQRRQLSELPAERLEDIGLTAAQAQSEARRPFWDAPSGWMR